MYYCKKINKMTKISLMIIFQLFVGSLWAQKTPKGDYKTKNNLLSDTIFLVKNNKNGGFDDAIAYMHRPCEFIDTSYYWSFYKQDSLKIETVIRKCNFNSKFNQNNKIEQKDGYSTLNLSSSEIRTSFWDEEKISVQMKENDLQIKNTKMKNDMYFYILRKKEYIVLVRKK